MRFSETHEWALLQGDIATVGVTEIAQRELGEVVYVALPQVGAKIKAGEEAVVVESTKAAVDLYSPLSGEIIEINTTLLESPEKINQAPQGEGWLFKLRVSDPLEYTRLLEKQPV